MQPEGESAPPGPGSRNESIFQEWLPDRWGVAYVALLVYTFVMVTGRIPIGTYAVILGLAGLVLGNPGFRFAKPLYWMTGMLFWGAVGWLFSDFPDIVYDRLIEFSKLILVGVLAVSAVRTRKQARFFLAFAFLCFLLYPVRGALLNYFVFNYTVFGRAIAAGIYENSNDLAALTLLQLSVAVSIYVSARQRWLKNAALLAAALMAITILLTQSRGVFLGALAFLGLVIVTGQNRMRAFAGVLIALVITASLVPASTFERFTRFTSAIKGETSISESDPEGSAEGRSDVYRIAWEISKDNPVFGVGMGTYNINNKLYAQDMDDISATANKEIDAHSTFMSLLAETGAIGLLLFVVMVRTVLNKMKLARVKFANSDPPTAEQLRILGAGYVGFMVAAAVGTYSTLSMTYVHLLAIWLFANNAVENESHNRD
ncbi:MAG: O-antigen ligase family protein [Gammaproteobacteria bacterium]|nr:O-antigen ligase family protein [Gammaproteobacteria bacterium]